MNNINNNEEGFPHNLEFQQDMFEREVSTVSIDSFGPWIPLEEEKEEQNQQMLKQPKATNIKSQLKAKPFIRIRRKTASLLMDKPSHGILTQKDTNYPTNSIEIFCKDKCIYSFDNEKQLKTKHNQYVYNQKQTKVDQFFEVSQKENVKQPEDLKQSAQNIQNPSIQIKNVQPLPINLQIPLSEGSSCYHMPTRSVLPFLKKKAQKIKSDYGDYFKSVQSSSENINEKDRQKYLEELKKLAKQRPTSGLNHALDALLEKNNKQRKQQDGTYSNEVKDDMKDDQTNFKDNINFMESEQLIPRVQSFPMQMSNEFSYGLPFAASNASHKLNSINRNRILTQPSKLLISQVPSGSTPSRKMSDFLNDQGIHNVLKEQQSKSGYKSSCVMVLNPLAMHAPTDDLFEQTNFLQDYPQIEKLQTTPSYIRSKSFIISHQPGENFSNQKQGNKKIGEELKKYSLNNNEESKDEQNKCIENILKIGRGRSVSSTRRRESKALNTESQMSIFERGTQKYENNNNNYSNRSNNNQIRTYYQFKIPNSKENETETPSSACQQNISESKYIERFISNVQAQLSTKENYPKYLPPTPEYSKKKHSYVRSHILQQTKNNLEKNNSFNQINMPYKTSSQDTFTVNCKKIL